MMTLLLIASLHTAGEWVYFTGMGRLPEEVSGAAVYDTVDPAEKELRATTNVTAAVWSCIDGALERWGSRYGHYDPYAGDRSSCDWYLPDKYAWPWARTNDTSRFIFDYTLTHREIYPRYGETNTVKYTYNPLQDARDILRSVANDGDVYFASSRWTSNPLPPEFEWTRNGLMDDLLPGLYTPGVMSWFNECAYDGSNHWKNVKGKDGRWLAEWARYRFSWGDFELSAATVKAIEDAKTPLRCDDEGLIAGGRTERFAGRFDLGLDVRNRRLDYYQLGAVEQALGASDIVLCEEPVRVGSQLVPEGGALSYTHIAAASTVGTVEASTSASGEPMFTFHPGEWQTTNTWSTVTNRIYFTNPGPAFGCTGCAATNATVICTASRAVHITYDQAKELLGGADGVMVTMTYAGGVPTISNGEITFTLDGHGWEVDGFSVRMTRMTTVLRTKSPSSGNLSGCYTEAGFFDRVMKAEVVVPVIRNFYTGDWGMADLECDAEKIYAPAWSSDRTGGLWFESRNITAADGSGLKTELVSLLDDLHSDGAGYCPEALKSREALLPVDPVRLTEAVEAEDLTVEGYASYEEYESPFYIERNTETGRLYLVRDSHSTDPMEVDRDAGAYITRQSAYLEKELYIDIAPLKPKLVYYIVQPTGRTWFRFRNYTYWSD